MRTYYSLRLAKIFVLILININSFSQSPDPGTGIISVSITGIKNTTGQINVNLFNNKDGFPGNYKKAYRVLRIKTSDINGQAIEFKNLAFGEYAIALIHDEDQNNLLKTGLFGIPQEGFGFSNNAKGKLGPPDFTEAIIKLDKPELAISIKMNY
jgi:uncharacterized protein (DUF2141 family)